MFSVMLHVGVGLNSDLDEASSCWELVFGAWARLEVGVGLQLTDLVRGMQGVGLNNSGLLLEAEARLMVGLRGGEGDWFWRESRIGGLTRGGKGYS